MAKDLNLKQMIFSQKKKGKPEGATDRCLLKIALFNFQK